MKILIIGTGYVGLVTGACFAEMGNQVTCLDIDRDKIESLKAGNLPFFEPGLSELVTRNVEANRLLFTDDYSNGVKEAQICFLALPTPSDEDGSCDLSYVLLAASQLAEEMNDYLVVVNKSTVPVGTGEKVQEEIEKVLQNRGIDIPFDIVSNPEFLCEGTAVQDFMKPSRVLLGVESEKALKMMKDLYHPFLMNHDRLLLMDIQSAELSKYAANTMLATRISFMNELSHICEKVGADIDKVRIAMGSDPRIGYKYLYPGIGFGGSCLPKDVRALKATAKSSNAQTPILNSVLEINERQRAHFFEKILNHFGSLSGKTLAIWGLAFKPNTDDLREAPALYLIQKCLENGANLRLYDPVAMPKAKLILNKYENVQFCNDEYEATINVDAIILVTDWHQFRVVDFEKIEPTLRSKTLFDARNQYDPDEMQKRGFTYISIGRKNSSPAMATLS